MLSSFARSSFFCRAGLLPTLVLLASCADDGARDPLGDGPVYLAATRVFSTDGADVTSYFHLVTSLEAGTAIDPAQALEVPGAAKLYTIEGVGWLAIGGGESPTITRYTLEEGRLVEGTTIGLQAYGVTSLWDTLYVVSPTKMYYPDRAGHQLLVIDPTAMAITGSVELPETVREGYLANYGYDAVLRDGALLFSVGWFDWDNDRVLPETGLVVLDTATDTVTRVDVDDRCAGVTQPVTLDSGDTYFVSSALAASTYALDRLDTAPCALRIVAGADAFDDGYALALGSLADGALVGEPVPADGNAIFLRVFDDALGEVTPGQQSWEVTGQLAWRWLRWDVASGEVTSLSLPASTADVLWFAIEGRVYGTQTTEGYTETSIIELTAPDGPTVGLTSPGFLTRIARIR